MFCFVKLCLISNPFTKSKFLKINKGKIFIGLNYYKDMQEKIFFQDSLGNKVCGILSNPSESQTIIILCHGLSSGKDARTTVTLERELNNKNITTLRFDFFGHGESEGKFEDLTISRAIGDLEKAIDIIKKRGYRKIGLFGSSFGGIACLIAASKRKDISVLALKSPVSDYQAKELEQRGENEIRKWKETGYRDYESGSGKILKLKYSFFEDFKDKTAYEAAEKIKIPTLIVHGDMDDVVPVEQSMKTVKILEKGRLEIIKGNNHDYKNPEHFERMIKLVTEFILKNLK